MRLPFLRSKPDAGGAPRPAVGADDSGSLQAARTQARRRLIGSLVLLVVAVVGFPLLFETQPRPLPGAAPADGAVVVIRSDPAERKPGADSTAARPDAPAPTAAASSPASAAAVTTTTAPTTPAAAEPAPAAAAVVVAQAASAAAAPNPVAAAPAAAKSAATKPPEPVAPAASAPVTEGAERWVVQVGAYNDMERMRQARQKVEKLGFKTYITDVDTATGKRTRVRLGPFALKKEAEAAAAKVKANGMAANVLSL